MSRSSILVFACLAFSAAANPVARQAEGSTEAMLDAMQQLLTSDQGYFDQDFLVRLWNCFDLLDPGFRDTQDLAWAGMVRYFDEDGAGTNDTWGKWGNECDIHHECEFYHEQNATAQDYHGIIIYEPCNYASNVAFYHDSTEICDRFAIGSGFSMPEEHAMAIGQVFSHVAFCSAMAHGSHTYLSSRLDVRSVDILSYVIHQASVASLGTDSPVINDLALESRPQTGIEITATMSDLFHTPVETWLEQIEAVDTPSLYESYSAVLLTSLTVAFEDEVVDKLFAELVDLLNVPEEFIVFLNETYLPELREITADLVVDDVLQFDRNLESAYMKLLWAFLWEEHLWEHDGTTIFEPWFNAFGTRITGLINGRANSINSFTYFEQSFQDFVSVYPGDFWCNPQEPHPKWHQQGAVGLLDLMYLADEMHRIFQEGIVPT